MGWNTSAIFVKGLDRDDVLQVLPDVFSYEPKDGAPVDGETAMSGRTRDALFVREQGGWVHVWDPDQRFAPRVERLVDDAAGRRIGKKLAKATVLAVLFASVTSTYGFWLYEKGKLVRHAMFASGEATASSGKALPAEAKAKIPSWGHDESFVWAVIDAVVGKDDADLNDKLYTEYTVS